MAAIAEGAAEQEDIDNVDFANYKGIYAEEESDTKYTCPVTGAHFEFNDVCKRLGKVQAGRKRMEEQDKLKAQQKQQAQAVKQKEVFSSSTMSVSDELAVRNNFHSSNLKAGASNAQASNANANAALYARQQQQQVQQMQMQQKQQQWMRDQQQLQQQQLQHQQQYNSMPDQQHNNNAGQQTQGSSTNLKHKKAQSNQMVHGQGVSTSTGLVQGSNINNSQTAQKVKPGSSSSISGKVAGGLSQGDPKFGLDAFVSSESIGHKYTAQSKSGVRQPEEASNNNMDSLEPDSVQQSTTKQLTRVNNNQINQPGSQVITQGSQKPMKSQFLQRNLTEVAPPSQYNVKKNNFFTEPDEQSLAQQSSFQHHNQYYGLKQGESVAIHQQQQLDHQAQKNSNAHHYANSAGGLSIDQQQQPGSQQQVYNVVLNKNTHGKVDSSQHYHSNGVVRGTKDSASKSSKNVGAGVGVGGHQRTAASHFATQDNRQPHSNYQQLNQKSTGQLSAGVAQPYMASGHTSKTVQGKTRKSTSLKTGVTNGTGLDQQDQLWQLNAMQQQMSAPGQQVPGANGQQTYQNVEQYNQLMAQLLKSQQKSSSVVGSAMANNLDKNSRTRTKSNATQSSILAANSKDQKLGAQKQLQKGQSGSQFIGSSNQQQMSAKQLQSQTFHVTDSSQYYSNGLQGQHTKTQQVNNKVASSSRNREGSSVSIGNRKNSSSQQKASLSNYIRQSQGTKQIKSSIASRNQAGIGGHLNSQATKHIHRSVASSGQQFNTMNNYNSNKSAAGHKSSNLIQPGSNQGSSNPTHKIIDEVVLRLSQQTGNQPQNLAMQPQIQGSRNQKNLMVSHTTGGPSNINKSSKHKSSGYFDQQAFQDIMQKYQRSNRQGGGASIGSHQTAAKFVQGAGSVHGGVKQYASQGSTSGVAMTTSQKNQLSAKKQARLSQYVHKEQKSRNGTNAHGVGSSKTINDTLHQQSIISQSVLQQELTTKDARSLKHGKISTTNQQQQRPMTSSNYQNHHSGMGSKSTHKSGTTASGNYSHVMQPGANNQQTATADMYHLSQQHQQQQMASSNHHQITVQGASKQKLSQPSGKPTIAIAGTTKRKAANHSNLNDQHQMVVTKGTKGTRVQNQKVHLQQMAHPPQQAMYSQEMVGNTATQEQMIMDYVNRMQHQQQQQVQGVNSVSQQQQQIEMLHQQHQQLQQQYHQPIKKIVGQSSVSSKTNQSRARTSGSHGMM